MIEIDGSSLTIEQVVRIARFKEKVQISKKNRVSRVIRGTVPVIGDCAQS